MALCSVCGVRWGFIFSVLSKKRNDSPHPNPPLKKREGTVKGCPKFSTFP
jgi:hypothetical protein